MRDLIGVTGAEPAGWAPDPLGGAQEAPAPGKTTETNIAEREGQRLGMVYTYHDENSDGNDKAEDPQGNPTAFGGRGGGDDSHG